MATTGGAVERIRAGKDLAPARVSEVRRRGIDLDALVCIDLGHRWEQTELARQRGGALKGLPVRICVCGVCNRQRTDVLTWSGRMVARYYSDGESYLENSRLLDDDYWSRRVEFRRLLLANLPGPRSLPKIEAEAS